MGQTDFQDRLSRIAQHSDTTATYEPSSSASVQDDETSPLRDIIMGVLVGFVSSFLANVIEFHFVAEGSAWIYFNDESGLAGQIIFVVLITILAAWARLTDTISFVAMVVGVFGHFFSEGLFVAIIPGVATMIYSSEYVSYVNSGLLTFGFLDFF
ncbi:MAG: hypothetical protein ABJS66_13685 [Paracoccaceae bacterium]